MALQGLLLGAAGWRRSSLDVEEKQALVGYGLAELHHRVLFVSMGPGRWIVGSPTGDVFEEDLSTATELMPLARAVPVPAFAGNIFMFRPSESTDVNIQRLRDQAGRLALV